MSLAFMNDSHETSAPLALRSDGARALSVEVLREFDQARDAWQTLAASGHATPYQRLDWIAAYFRHVEAARHRSLALIVLRDRSGAPLLLLPLAVTHKGTLRIASFIGGKHANFNMPLISRAAADLTGDALRMALLEAAAMAKIDLFALVAQPLEWEGFANPMARLGGQASPSPGFKLALQQDGHALLQHRLSKDARKRLRQNEARLQRTAPVTYRRPQTTGEAMRHLEEFLAFKHARFQAQGIDDPFAGPDIRAFLAEAVTAGFSEGGPSIQLHALKHGERTIAVYGTAQDRQRLCGLFTAFDGDREIARSSPGDLLLMAMIRQACSDGLKTFDLGVGEARYKQQVCNLREELFDSFVPATLKGRGAAALLSGTLAAKRWAKQSPIVTDLLARLRKWRARVG